MKYIFIIAAIISITSCATKPPKVITLAKADYSKDIEVITTMGNLTIRLSDSTPKHRDNFLLLVKKKYYDSVLFHRVINEFMIQGGDPDSKKAAPQAMLGNGGLNYRVSAEFRPYLFHKKGVLAAARDNNPEKESSSTQFYLVQGKVFTDQLIAEARQTNRWPNTITPEQEKVYRTIGGTPHLDGNYTVFGEVIIGLDIIDKIAAVPRDGNNRPLTDVRIIKMRLVKRPKK
jgi:cyclophilin family peptidyl-prolyl cis-trans isomerase